MDHNIRVHFMGICGSGVAAIALMAKKQGFTVTGCDQVMKSFYSEGLQDAGVTVEQGHSRAHLDDVDICAISPAILDVSPDHEEVLEAKRRGILMTWQEFMARYLLADKECIAISGTHGKSTATVLLGAILEENDVDPSVISGTIYRKWESGCRIGDSRYFVVEADEFNRNFLNYHPSIAAINNLEMDHPECFTDFEDLLQAFLDFIANLKDQKILIVNEDSEGVCTLLSRARESLTANGVRVIGYYQEKHFDYPYDKEYEVKMQKEDIHHSEFLIRSGGKEETFSLGIPGTYNVNNGLTAIAAASVIGLNMNQIQKGADSFGGIGRRFDLVGEADGIKIFDDYAHHPTAIESVLEMCKKDTGVKKIWVIFEPHQISRLTLFFKEFTAALALADHTVITKTHMGREIHSGLRPIAAEKWKKAIGEEKTTYIEEMSDVVSFMEKNLERGDLLIVFGAANSYKISRAILETLKNREQ